MPIALSGPGQGFGGKIVLFGIVLSVLAASAVSVAGDSDSRLSGFPNISRLAVSLSDYSAITLPASIETRRQGRLNPEPVKAEFGMTFLAVAILAITSGLLLAVFRSGLVKSAPAGRLCWFALLVDLPPPALS
jgi:hypothetical protein